MKIFNINNLGYDFFFFKMAKISIENLNDKKFSKFFFFFH